MINTKTVFGVIFLAILVGVLYVVFEKQFAGPGALSQTSSSSSSQKQEATVSNGPSTMPLPTPEPTLSPIDESSNLLDEASNLQMRDYSTMFEDLKSKVSQ